VSTKPQPGTIRHQESRAFTPPVSLHHQTRDAQTSMLFFGVPSSSKDFDAKPLVSNPIHPATPGIAHGATVAAAPKPTTLLGLPAELRNAIYTHVLLLPDPILIFWGHSYRRLGDHNSNLVPIRASPGECNHDRFHYFRSDTNDQTGYSKRLVSPHSWCGWLIRASRSLLRVDKFITEHHLLQKLPIHDQPT
jgi:hypothetical protein